MYKVALIQCLFQYKLKCFIADINECDSNPCSNGGTCRDGVSSYTCECAGDYTGTSCGN